MLHRLKRRQYHERFSLCRHMQQQQQLLLFDYACANTHVRLCLFCFSRDRCSTFCFLERPRPQVPFASRSPAISGKSAPSAGFCVSAHAPSQTVARLLRLSICSIRFVDTLSDILPITFEPKFPIPLAFRLFSRLLFIQTPLIATLNCQASSYDSSAGLNLNCFAFVSNRVHLQLSKLFFVDK